MRNDSAALCHLCSVVSVEMMGSGTVIRALDMLLFMREVRSKGREKE